MPGSDTGDWAIGISQPLRQLALAGASDGELQEFIDARVRGDTDTVNRLLAVSTGKGRLPASSSDGTGSDEVAEQLTIAALRPVVNNIDVGLLQRYVETVSHLSRHVVMTMRQEAFWSSAPAMDAISGVVARLALDQVSVTAEPPTTDEQSA